MFSSGPNYNKLKTNLRLALNRLKLLEKKKTELAQKARKEIADYLTANKVERARIRVEHIIREDYLVEAMEIVEMYCDMVLARFGLITQMKELDAGIAEAVYSLVWVCPRLQSDVPELSVISDIFCKKYGPIFMENARNATSEHHVSEKLQNKLQLQAPPKLLVEKYLIEIAKIYNIDYLPDPQIMQNQHKQDLSDRNNLGGGGGGGAEDGGGGATAPPQMGFIGFPTVPPLPVMSDNDPSNKLYNYPPQFGGAFGPAPPTIQGIAHGSGSSTPAAVLKFNIPPMNIPDQKQPTVEPKDLNTQFLNKETQNSVASPATNKASFTNSTHDENILRPKLPHEDPPPRYSSINPMNLQTSNVPKPQPRMKLPPATQPDDTVLNLPTVPNDLPDAHGCAGNTENDDEIDFDDLSRRFENLKKRS